MMRALTITKTHLSNNIMPRKQKLLSILMAGAFTQIPASAAIIDVIGNSNYSQPSFASTNGGIDGGLGTNIRVIKGTNVTWTKDNEYFITDKLFIPRGSTLTIQPGTKVYLSGNDRGTLSDKSDDFIGTITACRGGKLIADGTAAEPIVFTSVREWEAANGVDSPFDPDNIVGPAPTAADAAQWGGIILLGQAYCSFVDATGANAGTVQIEGFAPIGSASYDGDTIPDATQYGVSTNFPRNDADNSGIIRYCSIRHGGFEFATGREINGLTLGAVGSGTTIEFVEIYANVDDGIEFFGGRVSTRYMVMAFCQDDSFDIDEGYRGVNQFWLCIQNPGDADAGGEWDGVGGNSAGFPTISSNGDQHHGKPILYNATFIGAGANNTLSQIPNRTGAVSWEKGNYAFHIEDYFNGEIYNSVFHDFAGGILKFNDAISIGNNAVIENNTFGTFGSGTPGNNLSYLKGNVPQAYALIYNGFGQPIQGNSAVGTSPGFTSYTRNASNQLVSFNLSPAAGSPLLTSPLSGGAPVRTTYRGAFAPGANSNWAAGWTKLSQSGVLLGGAPAVSLADSDGDGIADTVETTYASLGLNPSLSDASVLSTLKTTAQFDANRTAGQNAVTSDPASFSLYSSTSILDLRTTGQTIVQAGATKVNLSLPVERSTGLSTWDPAGNLLLEIDKVSDKEFYRITVEGAQ